MFQIRINCFRIRIQHCKLITNPDPNPVILMNKNGKNLQLKKFFNIFLSTIAMYLSLGLQAIGEAFIPQKRTSSTSKHEIEISSLFSIFVGHFFPPGSGSTDLIESGSNPYPKHWIIHSLSSIYTACTIHSMERILRRST